MGLRVDTNIGVLNLVRNLSQNLLQQNQTIQNLSSGISANPAENPSAFVLFQSLGSDLAVLNQTVENTQNANNLIGTASGGLSQIGDLLVQARGLATQSLDTTAGSPGQEAAQNALDQVVNSINRIAQTSSFAGRGLLNGGTAFTITNASSQLTNINVQGGNFGNFPVPVAVNVLAAATPAQAQGTIAAVQGGASTVQITGPLGTQQINIAAGATQAQVGQAINGVADFTGVQATAGGKIQTTNVGSSATVNIQVLSGNLQGITPGAARGTDVVATVDGASTAGNGNVITSSGAVNAQVTVQPNTTGNFSFEIAGGGVAFQIGTQPGGVNQVNIGIPNAGAGSLGNSSGIGAISTIITGGANSLVNNPGGAIDIITAAQNEVTSTQGFLGGVQSNLLEANSNALNVAIENISAAASNVGDTNFAVEAANLARENILTQTNVSLISQSNLNAGNILRLLSNF